ncbi:peptidoglycan-binding protein [Streptomyces sp. SID4982]|uniref:peptidoglycan-binding protein n=1 Tax=Streptomyces sp. SID4982 TaxID=2690291 RepID=UPI00136B49E0|nr:peptidoglycan-binding protein [Streptomyces sp. SID4982]MYS15152.1 N-acetylmuramoyl-L-alanine amidase [Streptomyces sp. SID4982]
MKLVTREQLGWPESAAPTQTTTKGVKVHYEGTEVSPRLLTDHAACLAEWQAIRKSHLANVKENYSDVAYNYAACPHGFLLEGRGVGRRTGANGNQELNRAHYAIVGLVGSEGLTEPTHEMLGAIRDGIELLRQHGAGNEIKGHRDGYATTCPGGPLYAWVQKGAPRPGSTTAQPPKNTSTTPKFPGRQFFKAGANNKYVTQLGQQLVRKGYGKHYTVGPGPKWGNADRLNVQAFQRAQGWTGTDADGYPGPETWTRLFS